MCEAKWTQHDILQYLTDMYRLTCFACLSHPWSLFDRYMAPELFDSKGKITEKARGDFSKPWVVLWKRKPKQRRNRKTTQHTEVVPFCFACCLSDVLHSFCMGFVFLFLVVVHFLHVCYIVSWFLPGFCTLLFHRSSSMFHSKLVTVATCFEDDYPCIGETIVRLSDGSTVQIKASRNWSHLEKTCQIHCVSCNVCHMPNRSRWMFGLWDAWWWKSSPIASLMRLVLSGAWCLLILASIYIRVYLTET